MQIDALLRAMNPGQGICTGMGCSGKVSWKSLSKGKAVSVGQKHEEEYLLFSKPWWHICYHSAGDAEAGGSQL